MNQSANQSMDQSAILITGSSRDYDLIDSGDGEKLERFGKFVLSRPDPQALWPKRLDDQQWGKADGRFTRDLKGADWSLKKGMPERWSIDFADLKFWIKPTAFKHTGLFPEQAPNWQWARNLIIKAAEERWSEGPFGGREGGRERAAAPAGADGVSRGPLSSAASTIEVLNLFGYTGGATLACARAGAKVVHIDGSKVALTWARENAELSGLKDKPVRWILDDARAFVRREAKRGRKYHGIIMDPPAFGHGPENELWKIEDHFLPFLDDCMKILADQPLFFLINGYSAGYSAIAYKNNLLPLVEKFGGTVDMGELVIKESTVEDRDSRMLPAGIFARWSKNRS